jgi:hypothetical protein
VFGLGFATILTLIVTPAALLAIANLAERRTSVLTRLSGVFGRLRRGPASRTVL